MDLRWGEQKGKEGDRKCHVPFLKKQNIVSFFKKKTDITVLLSSFVLEK